MIIQNEKRKYFLFGTCILGILLAVLFIFFSSAFNKPQLDAPVIQLLYVLLAIALVFAGGMFLSTDSRKSAILFGSIFLILMINSLHFEFLYLQSTLFGFIIGAIISGIFLYTNRFDRLAIAARGLLTVFFFFILFTLVISYFDMSASIPTDSYSSELAMQILYTHLLGIIAALLVYLLLFYSIVGVKSSDIFVFGPRSSGKTYFMMGFFEHILNKNMGGQQKENFVVSPSDKAKKLYSLEYFAEQIEKREKFESTRDFTLCIYQFSGKLSFFRPVTWTFLDYSGEQMPEISEKKYKKSIKYLSDKTKISETELMEKSGTLEFCKRIDEDFRELFVDSEFLEALITVVFHGYIQKAGKIIFLADGEKVINKKDSRPLLAKEFMIYSKILNSLDGGSIFSFMGVRKKFCVVVTKFDEILNSQTELGSDLREIADGEHLISISEHSKEGNLFEERLHEDLITMNKYKNLENTLNDIDFHFIAVSTWASYDPVLMDITKNTPPLEPWGFDEVIEFGS